MFKTLNLITAIVSSVSGIGVFVVSDLFISAFFGSAYVLDTKIISALLGVDVYLQGIQQCINTYRNSMGLFQQAKYRPIFSAIFNLIISIALVTKLGISGVLIGTIASNILTTAWIDPVIVYKNGFMRPAREYFITNIQYLLVAVTAAAVTASISWGLISRNIISSGAVKVFIAILASCVVPLLLFHIVFSRTNEYHQILILIKKSMMNIRNMRNKK